MTSGLVRVQNIDEFHDAKHYYLQESSLQILGKDIHWDRTRPPPAAQPRNKKWHSELKDKSLYCKQTSRSSRLWYCSSRLVLDSKYRASDQYPKINRTKSSCINRSRVVKLVSSSHNSNARCQRFDWSWGLSGYVFNIDPYNWLISVATSDISLDTVIVSIIYWVTILD